MSQTAAQPATTPIPVQLSEPEFDAFILPHLSMPKRGSKFKMDYYRRSVENLSCLYFIEVAQVGCILHGMV